MTQHSSTSTSLGFAAITVTVLIWGSTFIVKEVLIGLMDPVQLVFLQSLGAALLFAVIGALNRSSFRADKRHIVFFLISGMIGIGIYQVILNIAIGMIGGVLSSILAGLLPAMCLISDFLLYKKKTNIFGLCSIIGAFAGVMLIIGASAPGEFSLAGCLLMLFSNCFWIYYCYFVRTKPASVDTNIFLFYQMIGGAVVLIPYVLLYPLDTAVFSQWDVQWRFAHLVLLPGMLSYLLFFYAVNALGVVVTNIANNLIPIATLLCNFLIFGQSITLIQAVGTCIVVAAVSLSSKAVDA